MNQRIMMAALLAASTVAILAACGSANGALSPNPSEAGGGRAESASPFTPPSPPPASRKPPASAPTKPAACGADLSIAVDPASVPTPICVHVGQTVQLSTGISPHQPWQDFVSSDPHVVACTSARVPDGAMSADCRALAPGVVTVSTGTMPFAGDPHGPAQYVWELSITVEK